MLLSWRVFTLQGFATNLRKTPMNQRVDVPAAAIDFNDEDSNTSANPSFDSVLQARLGRRSLLRGSVGAVGTAMLGGLGLSRLVAVVTPRRHRPPYLLGFTAVAKNLADVVTVPAGYTASVLYALGDPLTAGTAAYKNDGTDTDFDKRAGDHHDGMEWFGLDADGKPSRSAVDRGLLAINHEATTDEKLSSFFLHANGGTTTLPRPAAEVDKETAIHGVSVVEVKKTGDKWATVQASAFNFRLTALSDIEIAGPARGNALAGHQVLDHRHQDARHAQQLRHRQDALGQLSDR